MTNLQSKSCVPCQGNMAPLSSQAAQQLIQRLDRWELVENNHKIKSTFNFKNFIQAQEFAVQVGSLAEQEQHHPDISYGWGYCTVMFYTHKINGLHENDFIMAAKVSALL
ncbi:MAG: 4a-hydroxytetrahydrobiopterin dehydratase [Mariprofundaceae bacterium]